MVHSTRGIVLRTVKYGETSVIVLILTEKFGVQSYLVNGVRTNTKKSSGKAGYFQPSAILELLVYHNNLKQLQRIKEYKWAHLYSNIFSHMIKNAVSLFMVELLTKCLKQPEANADLFYFAEDAFIHLDRSNNAVTANFPLFFFLHLPVFFGFRIDHHHTPDQHILDLQEGNFTDLRPAHPHFLEDEEAETTAKILQVQQPAELEQIRLNHDFRRRLMVAYETYYALHLQEFGGLKTLPVLREILS